MRDKNSPPFPLDLLNEASRRMDRLEERIKQMDGDAARYSGRIEEVRQRLEDIENAEIHDLELGEEVDVLKRHISSTNGRVAALERRESGLAGEVAGLKNRVKDLEGDLRYQYGVPVGSIFDSPRQVEDPEKYTLKNYGASIPVSREAYDRDIRRRVARDIAEYLRDCALVNKSPDYAYAANAVEDRFCPPAHGKVFDD